MLTEMGVRIQSHKKKVPGKCPAFLHQTRRAASTPTVSHKRLCRMAICAAWPLRTPPPQLAVDAWAEGQMDRCKRMTNARGKSPICTAKVRCTRQKTNARTESPMRRLQKRRCQAKHAVRQTCVRCRSCRQLATSASASRSCCSRAALLCRRCQASASSCTCDWPMVKLTDREVGYRWVDGQKGILRWLGERLDRRVDVRKARSDGYIMLRTSKSR
jgi:hypothetical protein